MSCVWFTGQPHTLVIGGTSLHDFPRCVPEVTPNPGTRHSDAPMSVKGFLSA